MICEDNVLLTPYNFEMMIGPPHYWSLHRPRTITITFIFIRGGHAVGLGNTRAQNVKPSQTMGPVVRPNFD